MYFIADLNLSDVDGEFGEFGDPGDDERPVNFIFPSTVFRRVGEVDGLPPTVLLASPSPVCPGVPPPCPDAADPMSNTSDA